VHRATRSSLAPKKGCRAQPRASQRLERRSSLAGPACLAQNLAACVARSPKRAVAAHFSHRLLRTSSCDSSLCSRQNIAACWAAVRGASVLGILPRGSGRRV
jgi:hypothetical protein